MQVNSVLCVCTGNICRSPLAEGWLRRELPGFQVASAGVGAVEGGRMPEAASRIALRERLDLDTHRGRQITKPMVQAHDLVLVMEKAQRDWLSARFPEAYGRTFLLTHWTDARDVPDPFREADEVFEDVYRLMVKALEQWRSRLL